MEKVIADAIEHAIKMSVAWSQLAICGFAAVVLVSMWRRGYRVASTREVVLDEGIGWFAGACGVWAFVGLFQVVRLIYNPNDQVAEVFRSLLSITNSVCLIAAGVHLDAYKRMPPNILAPAIQSLRQRLLFWSVLVTAPPFIVLGMFGLHKIVDVVLSVTILGFLLYGFFISFRERKFFLLAYVSIGILLLVLVAQIPELSEISRFVDAFKIPPLLWLAEARWPLLLVSKVLFVLLYLTLSYSWMYQRSEGNSTPEDPNKMPPAPALISLTVEAPQHNRKEMALPIRFRWRGDLEGEVDLEGRLYHRLLEGVCDRLEGQNDGWKRMQDMRGLNQVTRRRFGRIFRRSLREPG